MRYIVILLSFISMMACESNTEPQTQTDSIGTSVMKDSVSSAPATETCWQGLLGGKDSVFIHYSIDKDFVIGEIVYTQKNSKQKFKLVGIPGNYDTYKLWEFDDKGNVRGVMDAIISDGTLDGSWFTPDSTREKKFILSKSDSVVSIPDHTPVNEIFGKYAYNFGPSRMSGVLDLRKINDTLMNISIEYKEKSGVGSIVPHQMKYTKGKYVYDLFDIETCDSELRFYNGVVYVFSPCEEDLKFGKSMSMEGIYIKIK